MSKKRKALVIVLTVWGSIVTFIGVFLLAVLADLMIEEASLRNSDHLEASLVLGGGILLASCLAGVLPLVFGIKMLRKKKETKK